LEAVSGCYVGDLKSSRSRP